MAEISPNLAKDIKLQIREAEGKKSPQQDKTH